MTDKYGRLMVDIDGTNLSDEDKILIANKHIGGLILFKRNFDSYDQICDLVNEIHNVKKNIIIAVDQEGGSVQRFDKDFTKIPSMKAVSNHVNKKGNNGFMKDLAWLVSSELISAGIDINFAPVLDIDRNISSIIGDRSFSDDVTEIIKHTSNFIDGMHEAGMKSTGKHFPGHGNVNEDSHLELPIDKRELHEIISTDIKPYIDLKEKLDAIMCAHILFPEVDSNIPSFSHIWINDVLKNNLKFEGIVFTDDLSMLGSGDLSVKEKINNSLNAGCDMIIVCKKRNEIKEVIKFLDDAKVQPASNISTLKSTKRISWDELSLNERAIQTKKILNNLGN
tara:strand:+ start:609 stop:1619 length:1011 start_codon:yes stop_codon:yes gene_type:complete